MERDLRAGVRRSRAVSAAILAASLVACGQRGPLYLPKPPAEPPPRVRAPAAGTAVSPPAGTTGGPAVPGTVPAAPAADGAARRPD
jgi:predicted small lipoprotein YifL